jgi:hypothetical protein
MNQREKFERIETIFLRVYQTIGFAEILFSCVIIFFIVSKFPETITVYRDKDGLPVFAETYLVVMKAFAWNLILGLLPWFSAFCKRKYPRNPDKPIGLPYRPPLYGSVKTLVLRYCIMQLFFINCYVCFCFLFVSSTWKILQTSLGKNYEIPNAFLFNSWVYMIYVFLFLLDIYVVRKKR